jgi:dTDP-glucose 4,6-dehydratase
MSEVEVVSRRVLVTGGAGFIGSAFVDALLAAPHVERVVVLDALTYAGRRENLAHAERDPRTVFVHGDICDRPLVTRLFADHDFDAVAHLAAESHVDRSIADASPFIRTNVLGTSVLVETAHAAWGSATSGRRFLHVSSDEVYGALGPTGRFNEESPYAPTSPYAASKAASDLIVRAFFRTHGFPAVITHSSNNYGPRQLDEKLVPRMIACAIAGDALPVYGEGKEVREWLHVDDHVRGLLAALARGAPGEAYDFGGETELPNLALVHLIADLVDAAMSRAVGTTRARIAFVANRAGHDFRYAIESSKARARLGWSPRVRFDEGLRATVAWSLGDARRRSLSKD